MRLFYNIQFLITKANGCVGVMGKGGGVEVSVCVCVMRGIILVEKYTTIADTLKYSVFTFCLLYHIESVFSSI